MSVHLAGDSMTGDREAWNSFRRFVPSPTTMDSKRGSLLRRFPLMYLTCLFSIHLLTMVSRGSWPIGRKYRKSKIIIHRRDVKSMKLGGWEVERMRFSRLPNFSSSQPLLSFFAPFASLR